MRETRYQGAIVNKDKILLIKHLEYASGRSYWVIPGGGREPNETETKCVVREMREETTLEVKVVRLLDESQIPNDPVYKNRKTYLCNVISGQANPGYEPEEDAAASYKISEVAWFDLKSEERWDASIFDNPIAYPVLHTIRQKLSYV
ncbi:MAG: NUDIX domain-containing protein [Deinococcota bacterium]